MISVKSAHFLTVLLLLIALNRADAQYVAWSSCYGGDHNDKAFSVLPLDDGGFAVFGHTYSFGSGMYDFYFVRTDSLGNQEWTCTYGSENDENASSMDRSLDGGFFLAGSWHPEGTGHSDMYAVKIDSLGNQEWEDTYGFGGNHHDYCTSICHTSDGGCVIAGYTDSTLAGYGDDILVIKIDQFGNVQWQSLYGGDQSDWCTSVVQTADGGFFISGSTNTISSLYEFYAIKTDSMGNIEWESQIGGAEYDRCTDGIQTSDGEYALTGYSDSFSSPYNDVYTVKLDSSGAVVWETVIGNEYDNQGRSICQTTDQGFIVCGNTELTSSGHPDGHIVKLDSSGSFEWELVFGGDDNDYLYSIEEVTDGEYITAGFTGSYGPSGYNFWLVKIETEVGISTESPELFINEDDRLTIAPNPANHAVEITYELEHESAVSLTIYGTDGRMVYNSDLGTRDPGYHSTTWNARDMRGKRVPGGLYFVLLDAYGSSLTQSVLILD